jgi:hypothetical protein
VLATYLKTVENLEMANNTYVIKLILDYKGKTSDREYLIKWEGAAELSWIHKRDIFLKEIIAKY